MYLAEEGVEVFLPMKIVAGQGGHQKRRVKEALFPGYLFAQVDERERLQVLRAPGVVGLGGEGEAPSVVDPAEVAQLRILQNAPERLGVVGFPLPPPGERIEVGSGPLQGLIGEVVGHRGRLYVVVRVAAVRQAAWAYVPVHELVGGGTGAPPRIALSRWPRLVGAGLP